MRLLIKLKHCVGGKAQSVDKEQKGPSLNYSGEIMKKLNLSSFIGLLNALGSETKRLIRNSAGLFRISHPLPNVRPQGDFAAATISLLKSLKFDALMRKLGLNLLFRLGLIVFLSMAILPLLSERSFAQQFNYHWRVSGSPLDTLFYVNRQTPASQYPYLEGLLDETNPRRHTRAYLMYLVDNISTSGDWPTTDDVHINAAKPGTNTDGENIKVCSGETLFVKKIDRTYGTWYFEARNLYKDDDDVASIKTGEFRFWFCPKKSAIDALNVGDYYTVFLNARARRHDGSKWVNGQHRGNLKVTVIKTAPNIPDLKWNGGDGWLKQMVADGSQRYDDLDGFTVFNSKFGQGEIISAVQEKWLANGRSAGTAVANLGIQREEIGRSDWGELERPLGDGLLFGTWFFSNNYRRFLFRPDAEAVNRLLPGERVRSHATLEWVDNRCHRCPHRIVASDTVRVQIIREGVNLSWHEDMPWSDNETGKLRYDVDSPVSSVAGRTWIFLPSGSMFEVSATDSAASSSSGMPESLLSEDSGDQGFSTEYISDYGRWKWRDNNSGFEFVPDWAAINALGTGNSATTTLELKIVKDGKDLYESSVTISVHGTTPILTIDDVSHAEGTGSSDTEFQFTIGLSPPTPLNQTFTVPVKFNHVTTDSADFVSGTANGLIDNGTLNLDFAATDIEKTITIQVNADSTGENEETFKLTLQEPTGNAKDANLLKFNAALASTVGVGTIGDDDRGYLAIDDITHAEGAHGETTEYQFTVSLSPATAVNQPFTVPITFAHVSTNKNDFMGDPTQTNYDLDFGASETSKPITITVTGDGGGEGVEQFTLTLSEPTGAAKEMNLVALSTDPDAIVGTGIIDNDDPKKLFTVWRNGFDGVIVSDGNSQNYGYEVGYVGDNIPALPTYSFTERKNGVDINKNSNAKTKYTQLNLTPYPHFVGTGSAIYILSVKNTYGTWYRRQQQTGCAYSNCYHFLFVPNVWAINQLEHGDVVTSTLLRQTWHQGYDSGSLTVTIRVDLADEVIGFDKDSRSTEVLESESVSLGVSLEEARENPITIPFEFSTGGSAEQNVDFMSPSSLSLTIPSGETQGTISIPIINDTTLEDPESFTVTLLDGTDFTIAPALKSSTITIIDDDAPEIVSPGGGVCKVDTKPNEVATPNTEVYWKVGAPEVDDEPIVYRKAGQRFDVQLGFRDHATKADAMPNAHNTFYFGVYYADGTAENPGISNFALSTDNYASRRISQPGAFRGYLRYRILPRNTPDNLWYYIGEPCEFHIWWTDANRPGISMSIEQETVPEGNTFRVVATATPPPSRNILVPFTISDESRIADSQVYNVLIRAGQAAGHRDIRTKFLANDQTADEVSVSAQWTHNYWLDDSKKAASVAIEDHDKKIVSFKSSDLDISVAESETAELIVELDRAHASELTVGFSVDDDTAAESVDYTEPTPTQITIPAGATQGTISIATISDASSPEVEDSKSFTVTLTGSNDVLPRDMKSVATVTILDDDRPVEVPGDAACHAVAKPAAVAVPNTEAYWNSGVPLVDGVPIVYREADDDFEVRIGFRDPATKAESMPNHNTSVYFAVYYIGGDPENPGIPNDMRNNQTGVNRTIGEPTNFRGYLRYRIIARGTTDQTWYHVGDPCEFHLWWTDANRPGIALSIAEDSVSEGNLFRVTATATPAPNRDVLVPISFSNTSRLADSPSRFVRIPAGEFSGHADILTKYLAAKQTMNSITVSTEWRSSYWLDESVKSASISITESSLPVLSVSAGDSVTEADNAVATFNVRSDNATGATEIVVNYTVTETGNFLRPPDPNNIAVVGHTNNVARDATMRFTDRSAAGDGSGPYIHTLEIPMIDNDDLESGQPSITVTLNADASGTKYQLSSNASASVTILDDDTLPVLSFEAAGNITEFDEPNDTDAVKHITFMVTATAASNPGTLANVRYTPSETGNFIDDANGNTPDMPTQMTLNFTGSSGTFTAPLEIPITADVNPESTGSVTVALLDAEGTVFHYKVADDAAKQSWTVSVYDNDIPELTIAAPALQFDEGASAAIEFSVTARFNVAGTMTVNFNVDEFSPTDTDTSLSPHTFVDTSFASPESLEFNGGTTAKLSVPISDDTDFESDRVLRITLVQGSSVEYTVAGLDTGGRAEITVRDDDVPVITVTAPESVKESDGTIEFMVSSLGDPGSALDFSFALSERDGSDYLSAAEEARTSESLTLEDADSDGTFSKVITVNLTSDSIGEPTGIVTLAFNENPGSYRLDTASKTMTVKVYDDDVPELHIMANANTRQIQEAAGAKAEFKVVASFLPSSPLTVNYTPESMNFLPVGVSGVKVSAAFAFTDESSTGEGPFIAKLDVEVDNDETIDENDQISVTLNNDEPVNGTYAVDTDNNTAAIIVTETRVSVLSVSAGGDVTEADGAVAVFTVSATNATGGTDIEVNYTVSETGNFLRPPDPANPDLVGHTNNVASNATMRFTDQSAAGDGSGPFVHMLEIPIADNEVLESGPQSITLTLNADPNGASYDISTESSASVTIIDDESLPVLSFETEGNIAEFVEPKESDTVKHITFMVTAMTQTNPGALQNVRYVLSESGNFIDGANGNTADVPTQSTLNFNGSGGTFTAPLELPIDPDDDPEPTGSVTVTLLNAEGYAFRYKLGEHRDKHSWTVTVYDDDTPELTIAAPALRFLEGDSETINFTVTARTNVDGSLPVNFKVEEFAPTDLETPLTPLAFVDTTFSGPAHLEFNGNTTAALSVPITDDDKIESTRVVRITLVASSNNEYAIAGSDSGVRTEITVADDDGVPPISVSGPESVRESDGTIEFTVSSFRDPGAALVVGFTLTEGIGSDYLMAGEEAKTSETLTLGDADGDGIFSSSFTIGLTDDEKGEPTGLVTLTLAESEGDYRLDAATKTSAVRVFDDDVPEIHFADDAGGDSVLEANSAKAEFKVSAGFLPSSPLTIHYTPVSANFLSAGSSGVKVSTVLTFTDESANGEGPFTANLEVPVDNDDITEDDGPITVTLNIDEPANETYTVDAQNNEASVVIKDDESLTTLTIDGPESVLESAGAAVFTIIAHAPANPGDNFDVVYAVSQDGNFLNSRYSANPGSRQTEGLNFAASSGNFTANLTIDLDNDDTGEPTGSVKVRLEMNTGGTSDYVLGGRVEHTVRVYDDDAPLIWIETVEDHVVAETGAMSSFMLHSRSPLSTTIGYRVDESSFIDATHEGMQTTTGEFEDPAGSNQVFSKQIDIPLKDVNSVNDAIGEVTVTLLQLEAGNNPEYMVATNDPEKPDSATVQVFNVSTGPPFAVVSSHRKSVTEGEEIVFNFSIIPTPRQDVQVRLKVSQQGNFIPWSTPETVTVPPSGAVLKIPTIDTDAVENGLVTVEVLDGPGYRPGSSKSVIVNDRDDPTPKYSVAASVIRSILMQIPSESSSLGNQPPKLEISIRAVSDNVEEGESAEFVIFAGKEPVNNTVVNVGLSQQGDFVSGPMHRSVVLTKGMSEEVLVVETEDDELAEADGRITATIEIGIGYRVGSQNSAHVAVSDTKDRQVRKSLVSSALQVMLPNLLADSSAESLRIVSARAEQSLHGNASTSFELNGHSQLAKMLESGGEMLNAGEIDWRTIIDDSSFTVALHPEGEATSFATVWGFGDERKQSGKAFGGQQSWQGETSTGHFGFDAAVGQGMLAGMAVSVSDAAFDYGSSGTSEISVASLSTGVHPFMGFSTDDGSSRIQVMAGYGGSEFELKQEQYSPEILTGNYHTLGISGRSQLYSSSSFWEGHSLDLSLAGDAWHAQQSVNSATGLIDSLQLSASHVRIAMDGQHSYHFAGGGAVTPSLSIGLRGDGRNEEFASAMDLDSAIRFENRNGFTISGAGKTLLADLNRVRNWEVKSMLDYDSDSDGKGILFSVSPAWHGADADAESYIRTSELTGVAHDSSGTFDGSLLAVEIGYGFEILDESAVLTPFHAFNRSQNHGNEFGIGSRIATTTGIDLEFTVVRETSETSNTVDHEINMNGSIRW